MDHKVTKFHVESEIERLLSIIDDLNDISYNIDQDIITEEEISFTIDGLAITIQNRINKLIHMFGQFVEDNMNDYDFFDDPRPSDVQHEWRKRFDPNYDVERD